MTAPYLLPIRTAALLFPALAFLMLVPTAIVLYRRHGVMTRWRVLSLYGGVYYALTAFCMTIVPLPSSSMDVCKAYPTFARPQFTPGVAFSDIWKEAHHRVSLDALALSNPAFWQTVFNLILLLPLGVFVRIHFRRGLAAATAAGFAASLFFELTQYTGLWGLYECPYRLFAVDDLIANTAGAALGWIVAAPLARMLPRLDALDDRALAPLAAGKIPFGRRLVALLLDLTGIALLTPILAAVGYVTLGQRAALLMPLVASALWFVVIPWRTGTTPGKHLLLLRLTTPEGERPTLAKLALRAAVLSPLLLLAHFTGIAALSLAENVILASGTDPSVLFEVARQADYRSAAHTLAEDPRAAFALLLPPVLFLILIGLYVRAVRRHPKGLGPHETLSGVHNQALPHKRAQAKPQEPDATDTPAPPSMAAAGTSRAD